MTNNLFAFYVFSILIGGGVIGSLNGWDEKNLDQYLPFGLALVVGAYVELRNRITEHRVEEIGDFIIQEVDIICRHHSDRIKEGLAE